MRCAGLAVALLAALPGGAGAPANAASSREDVRLALLDYCVITEWSKRKDTSQVAKECACAAARAAKALPAASVTAFDNKLSGKDETLWTDATKACFKSR